MHAGTARINRRFVPILLRGGERPRRCAPLQNTVTFSTAVLQAPPVAVGDGACACAGRRLRYGMPLPTQMLMHDVRAHGLRA